MAIPRDVGFGLNDFQEMQVYSEGESIARYLLNILLMRPGNLQDKIISQCTALMANILTEELFVGVIEYKGNSFLLIRIPVLVDNVKQTINYAFYQTEAREIKFDFEIEV